MAAMPCCAWCAARDRARATAQERNAGDHTSGDIARLASLQSTPPSRATESVRARWRSSLREAEAIRLGVPLHEAACASKGVSWVRARYWELVRPRARSSSEGHRMNRSHSSVSFSTMTPFTMRGLPFVNVAVTSEVFMVPSESFRYMPVVSPRASVAASRKLGASKVNVATPVDPSFERVSDTSGTHGSGMPMMNSMYAEGAWTAGGGATSSASTTGARDATRLAAAGSATKAAVGATMSASAKILADAAMVGGRGATSCGRERESARAAKTRS